VFQAVVHCIAWETMAWLRGDGGAIRVEVFDKMGNFQSNILLESKDDLLQGMGSIGETFSRISSKIMLRWRVWHDAIRITTMKAFGKTLSSSAGLATQGWRILYPPNDDCRLEGEHRVGEFSPRGRIRCSDLWQLTSGVRVAIFAGCALGPVSEKDVYRTLDYGSEGLR